MFNRILIANRGEIACRIIDTCRILGVETVAVFSEADAGARHVAMADHAVPIGPAAASESYLRPDIILEAARKTGAEAIHPGYGFLSENADFAEACVDAGLVFIGPPAAAIRAMGSKSEAKALMGAAGVPLTPGYHGTDQDGATLKNAADDIGYPVLIKASAGGGGKGMRLVDAAADFEAALDSCRREAASSFGDDRVLVERFVTRPRHIEIQVFADGHGNVVHLYERDCSVQRRHQKVIEEAPAPGMTDALRAEMGAAAIAAAKAVDYRGAGTVEFIVETNETGAPGSFFFMEMNTRLQVEHPVTECITGFDLVEWQLRVASGEALPVAQEDISATGHAVEVRLYAEDPDNGFLPSVGALSRLDFPDRVPGIRIETGVRDGDTISPYYDPMIAKVIAEGCNRGEAIRRLVQALRATEIAGITGNRDFLIRLLSHSDFMSAQLDTGFIDKNAADLLPPPAEAPCETIAAAVSAYMTQAQKDMQRHASLTNDPHSPWAQMDGWRIAGNCGSTLRVQDGMHQRDVSVTSNGGMWAITVDGALVEPSKVSVILEGPRATVFTPDRILCLDMVDPRAVAAVDQAVAGALTAPMPGKITAVFVAQGDEVNSGDPLLVLEAMKMEHTIRAPVAGQVAEFSYEVDAQVAEGDVLAVVVEPSSE